MGVQGAYSFLGGCRPLGPAGAARNGDRRTPKKDTKKKKKSDLGRGPRCALPAPPTAAP
eukprot:gene17680-39464_t